MSSLELVVARYDEDLMWLRRVPRDFRVAVYDKGGGPSEISNLRSQISRYHLPNIGHETHTYLHHIVARYDELADLTVFCQGKPFDHVPDFHRILWRLARGSLKPQGFLWLGFVIDREDRGGSLFRRWHPDRSLPIQNFWAALWNTTAPEHLVFYPGGHFLASAETVRAQPRSFYEKALEVSANLPDAGHCFERCWDRVFGVDGIPPEYRDAELPVYFRPIRRLGLTWAHVPSRRL